MPGLWDAGISIQDFVHAQQAPHGLSYILSPYMVNFIPLISNSKKLEWGSSEGPDLDEDVCPLRQKDVPTLAWETLKAH